MTLIQAMAYFLEVAKGWRFYGCALYPMKVGLLTNFQRIPLRTEKLDSGILELFRKRFD